MNNTNIEYSILSSIVKAEFLDNNYKDYYKEFLKIPLFVFTGPRIELAKELSSLIKRDLEITEHNFKCYIEQNKNFLNDCLLECMGYYPLHFKTLVSTIVILKESRSKNRLTKGVL